MSLGTHRKAVQASRSALAKTLSTSARSFSLSLLLTLPGCMPSQWEILLVAGVIVLLFGASRLPQLGRALGETIRGFKSGLGKDKEDPPKALQSGEENRSDNSDSSSETEPK